MIGVTQEQSPSTFICLHIPGPCVDSVRDDISTPALLSVTVTNEMVDNALILLRSILFIAVQMCYPVVLRSGHCESTWMERGTVAETLPLETQPANWG